MDGGRAPPETEGAFAGVSTDGGAGGDDTGDSEGELAGGDTEGAEAGVTTAVGGFATGTGDAFGEATGEAPGA